MKTDVPTFRQAAELMDDGPAREAVFKFAREYYNAHRGEVAEIAVGRLSRAIEMQSRVHEKQAQAAEPELPAGMREFLRANGQIERFLRWSDNLWEAAFRVARNRLSKELGIQPPPLRWLVDDAPAEMPTRTSASREPGESKGTQLVLDTLTTEFALREADKAEAPPVPVASKKRYSPYRKPKIRKGVLVR